VAAPSGGMRMAWQDILNRWWQWIVALAVVVGVYLAAAPEHKVWVVWALVGAGLILAVGTVVLIKVRRLIRQIRERLRKYPELEAEVKLLRAEISEVRRQASGEKEQAEKEARTALLQGRSEAIGVFQAVDIPCLC
jgi:cell shape-determining protein MreC